MPPRPGVIGHCYNALSPSTIDGNMCEQKFAFVSPSTLGKSSIVGISMEQDIDLLYRVLVGWISWTGTKEMKTTLMRQNTVTYNHNQ